MSAEPADSLAVLASWLRGEETVISPYVVDPGGERPVLGLLAAAGPRAADSPAEYALLIESIREGYLLHYGEPRIVRGADADLTLLAGDYLFARGLERLAALGDLDAVRELSDLIALSAQVHAERGEDAGQIAARLWLVCVLAVAVGGTPAAEAAKATVREGRAEAEAALEAAIDAGGDEALRRRLEDAGEAIGFPSFNRG